MKGRESVHLLVLALIQIVQSLIFSSIEIFGWFIVLLGDSVAAEHYMYVDIDSVQ